MTGTLGPVPVTGLVDLLDHLQEGRCMERCPVREDAIRLRPVGQGILRGVARSRC